MYIPVGGKGKWENLLFSRKIQLFLGWDGGRFGGGSGQTTRGGRGEAPLHFLVDSFGADGKGGVFGAVAQVGKSA